MGLVSGCETQPLQEHHKAQRAKHSNSVRDHARVIYTLCMYTTKMIMCKYLCNFSSATQLQNPTARNFHVCQPISTTAWMYACVFTHLTLQIPGQTPAQHTLIPLGREYNSTQVTDASHVTLPSPGKNSYSAMGKTA